MPTEEQLPAPEPLGEIELGLSLEQAAAIVREFDLLWAHANVMGRRRVNILRLVRDQLEQELTRSV